MIIDTHAHMDYEQYQMRMSEIIETSKKWGIEKIIIPSVEPSSWEKIVELIEKYDIFYGAIGIHPSEAKKYNDSLKNEFTKYANHEKVVAIGEIGLDYYWDNSFNDLQKDVFKKQIEIAKEVNKPILIHDREAHKDTFDILKQTNASEVGVLMHCYSGSVEFAKECIKQGFYIAIGGVVTFKNAKKLKEVVKEIDLDYLMLETDSPYLTPTPYRGKENMPYYTKFVADEIALIKKISKEKVYEKTTANAKKFFKNI